MREFETYGPHKVPVEPSKNTRYVDDDALSGWWSETDRVEIAGKKGCYVFAMRHGQGTLPLYVGMTSAQTFRSECFSPRNLKELNRKLESPGTLLLFLIAPIGPGRTGAATIKDLERYLIGLAAVRNPDLINTTGRGVPRPLWTMPGIGGSPGRPHKPTRDLAGVLGVKDQRT